MTIPTDTRDTVCRRLVMAAVGLMALAGCPSDDGGEQADSADADSGSGGATDSADDTSGSTGAIEDESGDDETDDDESGGETGGPLDCDPACVEANGGFELPSDDRPAYWFVTAPPGARAWSLDPSDPAEGEQALALTPDGEVAVSQVLHLPGQALEGRTVTLSLQVKHEGTDPPPAFAVVALNPEAERDPAFGTGTVGSAFGAATAEEGVWQQHSVEFTATGPASEVLVYLSASGGSGTAWFDDVHVQADPWEPGPGPDPDDVEIPTLKSDIFTGFVNEGPMDFSELGAQAQLDTAAASSDLFNVFFHTSWCRHPMAVAPCEEDPVHARGLELAAGAHERGMGVILTLEFTHTNPDAVGELNPLPDGTPIGSLQDADVRAAYREELLWLIEQVDPQVVIIGVELNILADADPDAWDAFVQMEADLYAEIKAANAETHVTTYATIDWFVDASGALIEGNAAQWQQLLPNLDSIAYSIYPGVFLAGVPVADWPPGYFTRPAEIAPRLPLFVPEFGVPADGGDEFSEAGQADALRVMLAEFDATYTIALIWWQLYDLPYLGAPQFFKDSFSHIGMHDWFGTPRESFVVWQALHDAR